MKRLQASDQFVRNVTQIPHMHYLRQSKKSKRSLQNIYNKCMKTVREETRYK